MDKLERKDLTVILSEWVRGTQLNSHPDFFSLSLIMIHSIGSIIVVDCSHFTIVWKRRPQKIKTLRFCQQWKLAGRETIG